MLTLQSITVALTLLMLAEIRTLAAPAPVQVIYTGDEGCACPTKLGYQLNVPNPPKPKKYEGGDYGYRVEKPVQTKAKISYSFDFTVEQPRTPVPPKNKPSKLYAKVDRVAVHKSDCRAAQKSSCSCSSCSADKPRYVTPQINSSTKASTNAIRRRRDLSSHGSLLRKRFMRQQQLQSRPARYVKYYHKDLDMSPEQQHKMRLFGLLPAAAPEIAAKRKTKKATVLSAKHSKRWPGFGTRRKRDIKGEYDLLEQERAKMDLTAPEIIQFMPETLNPNFKRGQCHTGSGCCGAITASAPPPPETTETEARIRVSSTEQPNNEQSEAEQAETDVEQPSLVNSIPAKRSALSYYPEHQIPSPLAGSYNEYKFVDDSQLRSLLSTTSVPDPLEQSSTPLQFAGDLEAIHRRGIGSGYPVEHVADTQLDSIISGIVYQHPDYANPQSHYGGSLVDPEPVQKKQTTDFLKKLIDGRLGGWGFDTSTEPESAVRADYSTTPSKTYGFNTHSHNGYGYASGGYGYGSDSNSDSGSSGYSS